MSTFHKPKVFRSTVGCCICQTKSSSSRFTDSARYEEQFQPCFKLAEERVGEICNACVLLVKRWQKLPRGSKRDWAHVVDARAGPGGRSNSRVSSQRRKNEEDEELFDQIMAAKNISDFINLKDKSGDTVLHQACKKNMPKKAALLIKHGAKMLANSQDEMPAFSVISSIGAIDSFLEELKTEVEDISDFIGATNSAGESAVKHACNTSDWRSALYLKTGTFTGDSSKAMEEILTKDALGIQHIVECPALVPLLKTWSTADNEEEKKEAEQKIEAFFTEEINMIFLPTHGMEEEKKEWNRCHPMKSEFNYLELAFFGCMIMTLV